MTNEAYVFRGIFMTKNILFGQYLNEPQGRMAYESLQKSCQSIHWKVTKPTTKVLYPS